VFFVYGERKKKTGKKGKENRGKKGQKIKIKINSKTSRIQLK
jgi:hypothetical protein